MLKWNCVEAVHVTCRQGLIEAVTIGKGEGFKSSFHAAKKMYKGIDCML
jgi:hypothetical protein